MSSYIVVEANVLDTEKLAQYSQLAAPTVTKFGGQFIAKGPAQALHGGQTYATKTVIEFANEQQAKDWYHSEDYQALVELRNQALDSRFQLVSGL